MNYLALGKRIREERLKLNLTQEQLAESIDVSNSYIGLIERGERSVTLETLVKIAKRLGVTIDYLLKESIELENDNFLDQLKQLLDGRNINQKQMALDVLKVMFSHFDEK
ncbi:helix-turn-helix domain-containing protein [Clostridium guangxiense]|uniref:helix-turn-helix domain-containing protein n=1 Tax=Clostridium guangxiense TaxID=1662055 RepID=UPI001E3B1922|nr:helix-turn-helix transcriptional regulator [Clostridium guangxiense]MCD2346856.1 helix-turn-helix domain-containing protein [Clostridium guangxiense]